MNSYKNHYIFWRQIIFDTIPEMTIENQQYTCIRNDSYYYKVHNSSFKLALMVSKKNYSSQWYCPQKSEKGTNVFFWMC